MEMENRNALASHVTVGRHDQRIWEKLGSATAFQKPLAFLTMVLLGLVGVYYQSLDKVLNTHEGIMLLFITAEFVYSIACVGIKMLPHSSDYLPILNLICFISGMLGCELLASTLISPFWLFLIPLCAFLFVVLLCRWHQIYKYLCHKANLVFEVVCDLFQQIYQISLPAINILRDWSQEIFQLFCCDWLYSMFQTVHQAFNMCFSTRNTAEQEDVGVQMANNP